MGREPGEDADLGRGERLDDRGKTWRGGEVRERRSVGHRHLTGKIDRVPGVSTALITAYPAVGAGPPLSRMVVCQLRRVNQTVFAVVVHLRAPRGGQVLDEDEAASSG